MCECVRLLCFRGGGVLFFFLTTALIGAQHPTVAWVRGVCIWVVLGGAKVVAADYAKLAHSGWRPSNSDVARDVGRLLGGAYEEFLAK